MDHTEQTSSLSESFPGCIETWHLLRAGNAAIWCKCMPFNCSVWKQKLKMCMQQLCFWRWVPKCCFQSHTALSNSACKQHWCMCCKADAIMNVASVWGRTYNFIPNIARKEPALTSILTPSFWETCWKIIMVIFTIANKTKTLLYCPYTSPNFVVPTCSEHNLHLDYHAPYLSHTCA